MNEEQVIQYAFLEELHALMVKYEVDIEVCTDYDYGYVESIDFNLKGNGYIEFKDNSSFGVPGVKAKMSEYIKEVDND